IAGHRRKMAFELAGINEIPCIIREMDDDEAVLAMVDSNLQRERILPSEKAFAYKMRLEALNHQGKRTDLTSVPLGPKLRSNEEAGKLTNDSASQVKRYIRLTEIIPELLDMVDENKVAFRPAVELSYLTSEEQNSLFETMECEDCTPSLAQAIKMKQFSQNGSLNDDVILSIMSEEKPNQKEQFKIPRERISRFFSADTPPKKIEETIVKALEMYQKRQRSVER
ncbi:MAG: ParB/RepB/Spo0J family partition protein, partial [Oscillospiraceae bacterium]